MSWFKGKNEDDEYLQETVNETNEVVKNIKITFIDGTELILEDVTEELDNFTKWYLDKSNDSIFVFNYDEFNTYYLDKDHIIYLHVYED